MARRAARVDANHLDICATLRLLGVHVTSLAQLGRGCPDVLLSYAGKWYVAEIKDGTKNWKLTEDQKDFIDAAKADILIFDSVDTVMDWFKRL